MKDKILTIDVGTGSTRAAIVRIDGAMIGFAQREYEQTTPRAGWSEQAPSLWWQAACDCIREVLYRYPETAAQIAVIGACGQMHGTVLLDDRGELVEDRALLWNDKRSQPQVDAFNAREGWEKWLAHLNNPPAAAWPAFKLAWWRENHPDRWSQLAKVLMPKDYINFMLTGAMATDYSEASCYFLMDSETRSWSSQACETFGLRVDQLPELKLSSDIIGQVTQRAADLTGLPAGIPVVAGTSDMAASLLGSGVYEPGMASDSTGTSTLMTVVSPRPLHHPLVNNLHLANAAWGGFTILDAGGDAVRWARLALADYASTAFTGSGGGAGGGRRAAVSSLSDGRTSGRTHELAGTVFWPAAQASPRSFIPRSSGRGGLCILAQSSAAAEVRAVSATNDRFRRRRAQLAVA